MMILFVRLVPFMGLHHAPVALTPAVIHTVNRFLMGSYPDDYAILRFRLHPLALTMLHQLFTFVQLLGTQLTVSCRFPIRSIAKLLTTAPMGVLQSVPAYRLYKAFFRLTKSIASRLLKFSPSIFWHSGHTV